MKSNKAIGMVVTGAVCYFAGATVSNLLGWSDGVKGIIAKVGGAAGGAYLASIVL